MADICIFQRVEKKYLITQEKKRELLSVIGDALLPDRYGPGTICSLYLDTPDRLLIRNSIENKVYKEKLRLRSYGTPTADQKVFLEIKKKYKGVVYKRREPMALQQAEAYIYNGEMPFESQIMNEIQYAMQLYRYPKPAMLVAYEREAYYMKAYPRVRLTFDTGVRYREGVASLSEGHKGTCVLPEDTIILEIKTDGTMPLSLAHTLDECGILPGSFSKYGTAYRDTLQKERTVCQCCLNR